uniref:Uncharacterized protein n=1 Tax=Aegilops tauschii subsp. strangulata TaxID=200361 RepID=A0A453C4N8_AEGTS
GPHRRSRATYLPPVSSPFSSFSLQPLFIRGRSSPRFMALSFRQLWSVTGRLWRERRASSSTSSIRDALTALRTCASRAMATFCRAAGSTSDRHHDRPLAKVPVAVSCAFGPWERLGDYMPGNLFC